MGKLQRPGYQVKWMYALGTIYLVSENRPSPTAGVDSSNALSCHPPVSRAVDLLGSENNSKPTVTRVKDARVTSHTIVVREFKQTTENVCVNTMMLLAANVNGYMQSASS
jgi:hypothetical protein